MKKRLLSIFLTLVMMLSIVPTSVLAAGSHPFRDVPPRHWATDAVEYVYKQGMMNGTGSDTFSPNSTTTRAMIVTILHRMEGTPTVAGQNFTDVPKGQYYTNAVAWASANQVVNGYGNGRFGPNDPITREQMAAILYRYAQYKGYDTSAVTGADLHKYKDYGKISSWAKTAMEWACGAGLISGMGDGTLAPTGSATRAQIATILMRFCQNPPGAEELSAKEYYEQNSKVVNVIDVKKSADVPTEGGVTSLLADRGFAEYPITYDYSINGEYKTDTEVSKDSSGKHPIYQTFYRAENGDAWMIYVINGQVMASPLSFNLDSDLGVELLFSESDTLTSYDNVANQFYVTIPKESAEIVKTVAAIDANTLNELSVEKICKMTGAAIPAPAIEEPLTSEEVSPYSLLEYDTPALASSGSAPSSDDPFIIVSLGDSYSSGEGIEPFYGQDKPLTDKINAPDWLAHRSKNSWPGMIKLDNLPYTMSHYRVENGESSTKPVQWYFGAASGAETYHFFDWQRKTFKKRMHIFDNVITYVRGTNILSPQLSIFDTIPKGTVDYVTLTIGGNDLGFTDIITDCAAKSANRYLNFGALSALEKRLDLLELGFFAYRDNIERVYKNIEKYAGKQATIIVAGYPKLLDKNGKGILISRREAELVNTKVSWFNDEIEELVGNSRTKGMNIHFVDVEPEFDKDGGHQAYSPVPWINKIDFFANEQDLDDSAPASAYSIHPNKMGARVYADLVSAKIQELEDGKNTETEKTTELAVGTYVQFGSWNQKPLKWQVIHTENGNSMLFLCKDLFSGVFDGSLNWYVTNNLTTYFGFGSGDWENSDLRQYLNGESSPISYTDVVYDYSSLPKLMVSRPSNDNKSPGYANLPGFLSSSNFTAEERSRIQPVTHDYLISYTHPKADRNTGYPRINKPFNSWDGVKNAYSKCQQIAVTDKVFPLSSLELATYVVDNKLPYETGSFDHYWLRDSIVQDLSSYTTYAGIYAMTVGGGSPSSHVMNGSAGVRPACVVDIHKSDILSGSGTYDSPYVLLRQQ